MELTDQRREQILAVNQELSSKGLRVLAFAYRDMPGATRLDFTNEREYTFIGLISMIDPPRRRPSRRWPMPSGAVSAQ